MNTVGINRQTWAVMAGLVLALLSVYLMTMTGKPLFVADENEYADAAENLLHFGRPLRDVTFWEDVPTNLPERNPLPLRQSRVERAFLGVVIPWIWAAERLDGVGVWHVLMSMNAFVTPLACAALFIWALWLTRSAFAAGGVMLTMGLLTIFWPYAHTFFREQISTIFLVLGAGLWWRGGWRGFFIGAVMMGAAFAVKESVIFAAPGLAFLLIPQRRWDASRWIGRAASGVLGLTVAACLILIYTPLLTWIVERYPDAYLLSPQFTLIPETTRVALHSYLLAAAGSFWGTSPFLILALPGAVILWRRGHARLVIACVMVMLGTALGYALLRGEGSIGGNWFGGSIWPHRFLLPAIPFITLLTAPIWDNLGKQKNPTIGIITIGFGIYSGLWAVLGVVFPWDLYGFLTYEQSQGLIYWLPGLNDLSLSRVAVYSGLIGNFPAEVAWTRAGVGIYGVWFGICAILGLILAVIAQRPRIKVGIWVGISGLSLVVLAVWFSGLRALYVTDPYYQGEREDLRQLAGLVRERVPSGGVILLNQPDTVRFWFNAGKVGARPFITLPYHAGEVALPDSPRPTAEQLANPTSLLGEGVAPWITHVAAHQPRLWLVMDRSIDAPWTIRPVERFMAERYYLLSDEKVSSFARLLEYATVPAPLTEPSAPPVSMDATFVHPATGESIELVGFAPPHTDDNAVTVSLAWSVDSTPTQDVTVAVFVVNADNIALRVQGIDSWLGGTFKTSTLIPPGGAVWDNRGVKLPPDLPAGAYQIWVKVYTVDYGTGDITIWRPANDVSGEDAAILPADVTIGTPIGE